MARPAPARVEPLQPRQLVWFEVITDDVAQIVIELLSQLVAELVGQVAQRGTRPRLDRAKGDVQEVGDLALRHAAPVRELDERSLLLGKDLECAMDAPRHPLGLGRVSRAGVRRHELGGIVDGRFAAPPEPVDDRVAGDGEDP